MTPEERRNRQRRQQEKSGQRKAPPRAGGKNRANSHSARRDSYDNPAKSRAGESRRKVMHKEMTGR